MAKVFRFHAGTDIEDWAATGEYGHTEVEGMRDPSGDAPRRPITSIPSPFARIDLFKTAFKYVAASKSWDGTKSYHKLVSDALDAGEIMFNADQFGDRVRIIPWSPAADLKRLLESSNPRHRLLGETLSLFLSQDREAYSFDRITRLYLLQVDYKTVGGTSPSTLFFSSANDLSFVKIRFGNAMVFSDDYRPLYKRDPEYQRYLWALFAAYPDLQRAMPEFHEYMEGSREKLRESDPQLYGKLNEVRPEDLQEHFAEFNWGSANAPVEVLGFYLRKKRHDPRQIEERSDFVIRSEKPVAGPRPLVLQKGFARPFMYTWEPWDASIPVPAVDPETALQRRRLPGVGNTYPYLTVGDLLENYIVKVPYALNTEQFFDGNFAREEKSDEAYLLPLKDLYFTYFSLKTLLGTFADGRKPIELLPRGKGGVKVVLNIPIKREGEYISFEKMYYPQTSRVPRPPEEGSADGFVVEKRCGLTILPGLRVRHLDNVHYRVMLVDVDPKEVGNHLRFLRTEGRAEPVPATEHQRRRKDVEGSATLFYSLEENFDAIALGNEQYHGLVIPRFREIEQGHGAFSFAIDFGTTNTHIEYKTDTDNRPKPFDITPADAQIATLHLPVYETLSEAPEITDLIPVEFLPQTLGKGSEYGFPQRTAISEPKGIDLLSHNTALADLSIPFTYEKQPLSPRTFVKTNLKWSDYTGSDEPKRRVEAYFEELVFLIRNKVLLNHGSLDRTRLVWFYPSSMPEFRRNQLAAAWGKFFRKYISAREGNVISISESLAPFYHYRNDAGVTAFDRPVVSIDIGGGTSDVVVFSKDRPQLLTSFTFAANSIFGDGYSGSPRNNGFIRKFQKRIREMLERNGFSDLVLIHDRLLQEEKSEDIVAFWFSLETNKKVRDRKVSLSFQEMLGDDVDMKIVFLLFYGAIIFHVASLLEARGLPMPGYITFSGTGSKVLNVMEKGQQLKNLRKFTRCLFELVYDAKASSDIMLAMADAPKEITCKGGLYGFEDADIAAIKTVLVGLPEPVVIPETRLSYDQVTEQEEKYKAKVVDEVKYFLSLFKRVHEELDLHSTFGATFTEEYFKMISSQLRESFGTGLHVRRKDAERDGGSNIAETLFFYPLTGGLNFLASQIAQE